MSDSIHLLRSLLLFKNSVPCHNTSHCKKIYVNIYAMLSPALKERITHLYSVPPEHDRTDEFLQCLVSGDYLRMAVAWTKRSNIILHLPYPPRFLVKMYSQVQPALTMTQDHIINPLQNWSGLRVTVDTSWLHHWFRLHNARWSPSTDSSKFDI